METSHRAAQKLRVLDAGSWNPPAHWLRIGTLEMHTGGEPLRIVTSGLPEIPGRNVLEKRRYFRDHLDYLRTGLIWEPRGHADMYAAVLTPSMDADFDVFFLHNEGYSTMCGHAILALTKLLVECGSAPEITFQVPAGKIHAHATLDADGTVSEASFENVPSFVYAQNEEIDVPNVGRMRVDIAYGGAFYAIVEARPLGLELIAADSQRLIEVGRRITQACASQVKIVHPFEEDLSFLYGTIFTDRPREAAHHSRNVCIFADGELDRSPTGSGVGARAALHFARRELAKGDRIRIESILGTTMTVRVKAQQQFGPYDAIIPTVGGSAHMIGRHEFWFDPSDALRTGFILR